MALRYKVDVIQLLKDSGYSTYTIRKEKLIIENMLQKLRNNQMVSWATLDTICRLTHSQPGDILEYVPDEDEQTQTARRKAMSSLPFSVYLLFS